MLYSGSGGYLLGLVFVSLGLHMFHKLSRGLEITVADGAEGPQGLFGDLGEGRQAMWCTVAFLGTSHPISGPMRPHLSSLRAQLSSDPTMGHAKSVLFTMWGGRWQQRQARREDSHQRHLSRVEAE